MNNNSKPVWPHSRFCKLTPHMGSGQWCKKFRDRIKYFGPLRDPDGALKRYLAFVTSQVDGEGLPPAPIPASEITLFISVNGFLTHRLAKVTAHEASAGQYVRYRRACELLLTVIGEDRTIASLSPRDFQKVRAELTGGPRRVGAQITWIRTFFKWVQDHYAIRPRFGGEFERPPKRAIMHAAGKRVLWTPEEIRLLLASASPAVRCFILLGANCGFGQADCASLSRGTFDLESHWFPRGKTLVDRRCPFWPATVTAMCDYLRPWSPPENQHLFFVTRFGRPWVTEKPVNDSFGAPEKTIRVDSIKMEFGKLCDKVGIVRRPFYNFRHTFRSVADSVGDTTAIDVIMGHTHPGMKGVYTQLMKDRMSRLKLVTDHVHQWLFA